MSDAVPRRKTRALVTGCNLMPSCLPRVRDVRLRVLSECLHETTFCCFSRAALELCAFCWSLFLSLTLCTHARARAEREREREKNYELVKCMYDTFIQLSAAHKATLLSKKLPSIVQLTSCPICEEVGTTEPDSISTSLRTALPCALCP